MQKGGINNCLEQTKEPERRLTVRECARLQTFPDNYEFVNVISPSEAYRVIGNAVPPLFGFALGMRLRHVWKELLHN